MTNERAAEILEMLLEGIHPLTKEPLPNDSIINTPTVMRAIYRAVHSLHHLQMEAPRSHITPPSPPNPYAKSGMPWTQEDEAQLIRLFSENADLSKMEKALQRTDGAIIARLEKLQLIPSRRKRSSSNKPRRLPRLDLPTNRNVPWTITDDEILEMMFFDNAPLWHIADKLGRSTPAILLRLRHLNFIDDQTTYPLEIQEATKKIWTEYDIQNLELAVFNGKTVPEIAAQFRTTEKAIEASLFYMGLSTKSPNLHLHPNDKNQ